MTSETTTPTTATPKLEVGQKLAGCYTLKEKISSPGALEIWLARDEELDKDITLHFLPPSVVADTRAMAELRQETKRNRQLIHPHILRVHDLIEEADWAAISMDHADAQSLASLLQVRPNHCFSVTEIKGWVSQICQSLEDAHKVDLLHRDFTPDSVQIKKSGDVLLQNFGITRAVLDSLERSGTSAQPARLAYTSPQLLDGERPAKSDDIYSLGALIFELLTGQPPFRGGDLIPQIRKNVPPAMSELRASLNIGGEAVPKSWDREVAACLDKHTPARPKTAMELASKLGVDRYAGPLTTPDAVSAGAPVVTEITATEPAAAEEPAKPSVEQPVQEQAPAPEQSTTQPTEPTPAAKKPEPAPVKASKEAAPSTVKSDRPPIPEAEVISKTPIKTGGSIGSQSPAIEVSKPPPTAPQGREFPHSAFVTMEDQKRRAAKSRAPKTALAIAAVIAVVGVAAYFLTNSHEEENSSSSFEPAFKSQDSQLTTARNTTAAPTAPAIAPQPTKSTSPVAAVAKSSPAKSVLVAAASPTATSSPVATSAPAMTSAPVATNSPAETAKSGSALSERIAQAAAQASEKERAAAASREAAAAAQRAQQEKIAAQKAAEGSAADAQKALDERLNAAAAAKKSAAEVLAAQKKREDAQKAAQADAEQAQKIAAEKTRLAAEARKAVDDNLAAVKEQQAAQQRAEADLQDLQKRLADRRKAAEEAAKTAAAAEASRMQAAEAAQKAEAEMKQAAANIERVRLAEENRKAALEAETARQARAKERERLVAQAAAAQKAAEEAARLVQAAQKAEEEAEQLRIQRDAALKQAEAAAMKVPGPNETEPPVAVAVAMASPGASPAAVRTPAKAHVDSTLQNSLGMKFAPVGDVLFSVWQTRVRDFEAFAKATNFKSSAWRQPGFKQDGDHPVANVSWNDAISFCKWLTEKEQKEGLLAPNQSYRLPTDLEWSKAVGLTDETGRTPEARDMDVPDVYPWGIEWPPPAGAGNYTGEETGSDVAIKGYDDGFAWTSPVGSFKPNQFGLYDMGGNVWQWCMDWLNAEQKAKVLRGGSWYNGALKLSLLSSCRYHAAPDSVTDNFGFRVVLGTGGKKP